MKGEFKESGAIMVAACEESVLPDKTHDKKNFQIMVVV
jgi:hypothetical protein